MVMTYGFLVLFMTAIAMPIGAFVIFVVPALRSLGYFNDSFFLALVNFTAQWWWLMLPPAILVGALMCTRYLATRWNRIVGALGG